RFSRDWSSDVCSSDLLTKTSIEDAEALTGLTKPSEISAHFLKLGAGAVIVTLGAKGVYIATPEGHVEIAGFKVAAVDATGAGDRSEERRVGDTSGTPR